MMTRFVQMNFNYYTGAQIFLIELIRAKQISVTIASDPYNTILRGWYYDPSGGTTIGVSRHGPSVSDLETDVGFMTATMGTHMRLYKSYPRPSLSLIKFKGFLVKIEYSAIVYRVECVGLAL